MQRAGVGGVKLTETHEHPRDGADSAYRFGIGNASVRAISAHPDMPGLSGLNEGTAFIRKKSLRPGMDA